MIYRKRNVISKNILIYIIVYLIVTKFKKQIPILEFPFSFRLYSMLYIYARIEKDIHFKYKYQDKG